MRRDILDFEATSPTQAQRMDFAHGLGMSETAYLQILNTLIDSPEAVEADPVTVNRLRRVREARARTRRS